MRMREIKFRAWDADEGRMWYSHENGNAFLDNRNEEHTFYFNFNPKTGNMVAVAESFPYLVASDPFNVYDTDKHYLTTMQYTGLHDKNGKEIYEGDVVEVEEWREKVDETGSHWKWYVYVVSYQDQQWLPDDLDEARIIGNLYENPELLKALTGGMNI